MVELFFGEEDFLLQQALAALHRAISEDVADFNITRLAGKRLTPAELVAACEATPFLADRRLVIVDALLQRTGKDREAFRAIIARVPDTCHLVLVEGASVDRRNGIVADLEKRKATREFARIAPDALERWAREQFAAANVRIATATLRKLVAHAGPGMRQVAQEIEKLVCFAHPDNQVPDEAIDLLVADQSEHAFFAVIDLIGERRGGDALTALRRLFGAGEAPVKILFHLGRHVRLLLLAHAVGVQRRDELVRVAGVRPFAAGKASDQARRFTIDELRALHGAVVTLDYGIKTGAMEAQTGLELLVMRACGVHAVANER
jgi:DNA polymerase-3 subunit delta